LLQLRGRDTLRAWEVMIDARDWPTLVGDLLDTHYDPAYFKSLDKNYASSERDRRYSLDETSAAAFVELAARIVRDVGAEAPLANTVSCTR
jgi:hypothetical protein